MCKKGVRQVNTVCGERELAFADRGNVSRKDA